jgi:non-ribosomal peptide synthase protein (TIGR01720 family)
MTEEFEGIEPIAIIGMAARFPGAGNVAEFWSNLCQGVDSVTLLSEEWLATSGAPVPVDQSNYVRATRGLEGFDLFDAEFFKIMPQEAEIMDPEHRIFLESAWEALEDAGHDPATYKGAIGVLGGAAANSHMLGVIAPNLGQVMSSVGDMAMLLSTHSNYLTTRISYKLNLTGPSLDVQTACSTSLVATHLACQCLLTYQCDMALVGGVSILTFMRNGYWRVEGDIRSPDGRCRPFDAKSNGTMFGDGAGVVVLKRLSDALTDGDHIYALIRGSAVNNDGSLKAGFTAPSVAGQARVLGMAYGAAGVSPETVSYIEAHGTGTEMGDPIEIEALTRAFRAYTNKKQFCAIGSVKGNVGHTDVTSGVTSLIKTALALKHGVLPPSINYETPNPRIDFANSPFYVNAELREWKTDGQPRRAGVSSFGMGGTNVHAVLEEAPRIEPSSESRRWQVLVLSARSKAALERAADNLAAHLETHPELNLADVAYTLHVGRRAFEKRSAIVCQTVEEGIRALRGRDSGRVLNEVEVRSGRPVAFMFSGQGSQYVGMGQGLYEQEKVFREQVDICAERLKPHLGLDLRNILYPAEADTKKAATQLEQTALTQPALFVIEYALAQLWMAWGVKPAAMIGHSIGEYVAACLAGVSSLEDALTLVAARGRLMQGIPAGAMLAVPLSEEEVQSYLDNSASVAVTNGPSRCVVAGLEESIAALERRLADEEIASRRLHTSHAFHSAMMEPILRPFEEQVRQVQLSKPAIPYISNVTGTWITAEEATDPAYWSRHLRQTVRFSEGVSTLAGRAELVLLEVGPGNTLQKLTQQHPGRARGQATVASMQHAQEAGDDEEVLLRALGHLWMIGVTVDWRAFYGDERRLRVSLPTYPFERQRFWLEVGEAVASAPASLAKQPDLANWFYIPSWKCAMPPVRQPRETQRRWLLFGAGDSLSAKLGQALQAQGDEVVTVMAGEQFTTNGHVYTVRPGRRDDYDALWSAIGKQDQIPNDIVHLWNVPPIDEESASFTEETLDRSFYSLLFLAQAVGERDLGKELRLVVVSSGAQKVTSGEAIQPERAVVAGVCKAIPKQMPDLTCRSVDVVRPEAGSRAEARLIEQLVAELEAGAQDEVVAYRGYDRWVQTYEATPLAEANEAMDQQLREGGVYLVTGGLGGIGLTLAKHLARAVRAKLVLTSRSPLPEPAEWRQRLATHDPRDRTSLRIRAVQSLEAAGAEVLVVQADVADREQMEAAVRAACERFGTIHGVIHAAGVTPRGLIQQKTRDSAAEVLSPKVQGTRVLEAALRGMPLDFIVLCSSLAAVTGGYGAADYCAANAFMDAFAHVCSERGDTAMVSIDWDEWGEVGMAVAGPGSSGRQPEPVRELTAMGHPLLLGFYQEREGRVVFQMELSPQEHWVLSEHALLGTPTVPGTTYLELVRAAFAEHTKRAQLEIREMTFLTPLMVGEREGKEARLILEKNGDGYDFQVMSKAGIDVNGEVLWQTHVVGQVGILGDTSPRKYDVEAIRARCDVLEVVVTDEMEREGSADEFLKFGPRWKSVRQVNVGRDEMLALIELNEAFTSDLDDFKLHPATLDHLALLGGWGSQTPGETVRSETPYLPLSYERVRIYDSLPGRFYSYRHPGSEGASGGETTTLQLTLIDEQGRGIVEIGAFTAKRVGEMAASRLRGSAIEGTSETESQPVGRQRYSDHVILPEEGVEVLRRILCWNRLPQIVVSTRHLPAAIEYFREFARGGVKEGAAPDGTLRTAHPRPGLQTPYVAPRNEVEEKLVAVWQAVLGIEKVGVDDDFFDLGGDSLLALQVVTRAKQAGLGFTPNQFLQHPTIAGLAAVEGAVLSQAEQGLVTGPLPLTIAQRWFFETKHIEPNRFNRNVLYEVRQRLDPVLVEQVVQHLLIHHDALRSHFVLDESGWRAFIAEPDGKAPVICVDLSTLPKTVLGAAINQAGDDLQGSMNPLEGPLLRVGLYDLGADRPERLHITMHHMAIDAHSITILLEDFQTAYLQLSQGQQIRLLPKTTSVKQWLERLMSYARSAEMRQELDYWLGLPWAEVHHLPVDYPEGRQHNIIASNRSVEVRLSSAETDVLLRQILPMYNAQVLDVLLMSLVQAVSKWTGRDWVVISLTDSGRGAIPNADDLDLSRTIGWLAHAGIILLEHKETDKPGDALCSIRDQFRRIPNRGLGFDLLARFGGDDEIAKKLNSLHQDDLKLNYTGGSLAEWTETEGEISPAKPVEEAIGNWRHPQNDRCDLLYCPAYIANNQLVVRWEYSENIYRRATIEAVANDFMEALRALVAHCQSQPEC